MRKGVLIAFALLSSLASSGDTPTVYTLTIVAQGMSDSKGVLGIVVFNGPRGWPENVFNSFRHTAFPARPGTQTAQITGMPPGKYAVALIHDVNKNMKLDKSWTGKPREQWGMSNNPRARFSAPSFQQAVFELNSNKEINVSLQ